MAEERPTPPNPGPLLRQSALWTALLAAGVGIPAAWLWGFEMGLGVVLGALLGLANFALMARALGSVLSSPHDYRPTRPGGWVLPGVLLLKWPLVLLALAVVLLYTPARAEGVGVGVILSLIAAVKAAAIERARRRTEN